VFTEEKDDGGGGDNWTTGAISHAKLHHHQQTNIQFPYRPDALPVAQPTVSKHCRVVSAVVSAATIYFKSFLKHYMETVLQMHHRKQLVK